ncbi:DM13 domain-containing protein [Streptomyces gilvosporeus]|uniref:DM13 domain-containing protein n=1 Tax=Streptomyces gilvosporeus TaxID=553510 RepID=A0A1V0TJR3_9ACTN|nr:DM13 domain-containing protein [Streptomyces gilvosporeus]ARF53171.1 hypothetical protein B1H19_02350 [Streptomyces gilvosporeus]
MELGKLKGKLGNQNYAVPVGTDLSEFRSAVIWCKGSRSPAAPPSCPPSRADHAPGCSRSGREDPELRNHGLGAGR